jgi:cytochrome P450
MQPFLKCLIKETLRLWGPLNISNPRVSPGKVITGRYVPKGVAVEICAFAAAREPRVFPDPSVFNPSRWKTASGAMRNMLRPFSYGPRNCVGRHLAEIQLTLTVSRLYLLYEVVPHQSMIPEKMIQVDKGVLEPAFHHFLVIPTRRASRKPD